MESIFLSLPAGQPCGVAARNRRHLGRARGRKGRWACHAQGCSERTKKTHAAAATAVAAAPRPFSKREKVPLFEDESTDDSSGDDHDAPPGSPKKTRARTREGEDGGLPSPNPKPRQIRRTQDAGAGPAVAVGAGPAPDWWTHEASKAREAKGAVHKALDELLGGADECKADVVYSLVAEYRSSTARLLRCVVRRD